MLSNDTISKIANGHGGAFTTEPEILARELYDLNVFALQERYSDGAKDMIQPFKYDPLAFFPTKWQQYKSFSCYLYQCSEGKAVDEPLYKQMQEASNIIAHRLATEVSDAHGALWE